MNHETQLETQSAVVVAEYLMRVQVPAENVEAVLEAIKEVVPLKYGRYERVAFRHNAGTQQFKPLEGSCSGEIELHFVSYESGRDNPNQWWNRADLDWVPSDLRNASKAVGS